MAALLWLTRDLRLHDHPALHAALAADDAVVPVFCLDDRLLHGRHASGPRTQFLLECLEDLDRSLRGRGSALVVRRGPPERELARLAREARAGAVLCTADTTPFARARAQRVRAALAHDRVALWEEPGLHAVDDLSALRTRGGAPYTVFSPFHRTWLQTPRRAPLPPPAELPPVALDPGSLPSLGALGLGSTVPEPPRGGETEGRARTRRFLAERVTAYDRTNDAPAAEGTSGLSPYLHFGCISVRALEARLPDGDGAATFRRQLAWRDFHHHVLAHHPGNARDEMQPRFRGLAWSRDRALFAAWCEGRTGFPLVDAGMRQLQRHGWMHNRIRLVVGSFLTKDLGIDWRWGERWFMRLLVDGDQANNNGNWQWIASVGTDPQPAYRRMYNPARQQERFDPDGAYVRRYVPELRDVPDDMLAEPWRLSPAAQRAAGCVIGRDYPAPVVDHAAARRAALERYALR